MTAFEPDGVYNSIPYRVLPDCSIEAMMPGGLVKFKNMDDLIATSSNDNVNVTYAQTAQRSANVPAHAKPQDYYSILLGAINTTKQNSAQLRALVYERARFNLKRDILFGYSSLSLGDALRQINEFEHAVTRIEANAVDDPTTQSYREPYRGGDEPHHVTYDTDAKPSGSVQVLPPKSVPPLYAGLISNQRSDYLARLAEEFVQYVRFASKFMVSALVGIAVIATVFVAILWPSQKTSSPRVVASTAHQTGEMAVAQNNQNEETPASTEASSKVPFPLPSSFGIYVLSGGKLIELEPLSISIPDPRVSLSAEIEKPSATRISDDKPAFILFRRDLLNSAPQKITLRVIARVARETKIVGGKAVTTNTQGGWRIRDISRELKISPIPGQREMVMARIEDDVPLAGGRYALVLNRIGYDFTVEGPQQSAAFCLEKFETANGSVFNQCRGS